MHVNMRQLQSIYEGKKQPCDLCDYQATKRGHLTSHKQSKHEGKKYPCNSCDYQATKRGHLTTHKQSKHEDSKSES